MAINARYVDENEFNKTVTLSVKVSMGYSKISDYKQIFMDTMAEFQIDLGYAVSIVSDNAANMCKFACEID